MRIVFLEEECLLALKSNLPQIVQKFAEPNSDWVDEYFGYSPFRDTRFKEVEDFSLDTSNEKPHLTEFENVKRVYSNLDFIRNSQASDERLWAGLCISQFWNYVQYRWGIVERCTIPNVLSHFFFDESPRRSLTRNALSRLWWIGRLTVDDTREDRYELTKFVCENSDNVMHILERNISNSPHITRAFISALIDAREEGFIVNTDMVGDMAKYLNILGGTYILDSLPEETIHDKVLEHIRHASLTV